ncbi:MAG: hypothetical protein U9Q69_01030 [Nanoarchaeota archaeon]|nr:hypothetical protein [Nanoarchaeota archaeon]
MADGNWDKNKAIGNMAENIVEFLINSTPNWKCIKYGMENHIEELRKNIRNNNGEISKSIRSMPDFIAINEKNSQILLIDVKYRSYLDNREPQKLLFGFRYGRIKNYLEYWDNAYFIVVHPHDPYFFVINLKDVEWHKHFRNRVENGCNCIEYWDFAGIMKRIKDIFPELSNETLNEAIKMIPKRN